MLDRTLAILAGGAGSRMGRAKGSLRLGGRPVLDFLSARFEWPGPTLLVTAPGREHPPGWERFTAEVVDSVAGEGPLRGIFTALNHSTTDYVVVCTVDMPGVGPDQLRWLAGRDQTTLIRRPETNRIEPFPSLFHRDAASFISTRLQCGRRSVHALSDEPGVRVVTAPPWSQVVWTNLNRPADLAAFEPGRLT